MSRKERQAAAPTPLITPAQARAIQEGEQRRQDYLATLDPRQREMLDPG